VTIREKAVIGTNCIGCYACTQNCPVNAIRVKGEKSKARYRNKSVTIKEIIDSNNQE
jgi:formate hydrogenlyase subunit 6/NADH:ubiquinone oxidoreductase subunit I